MERRLYRSKYDRMIWGVCGGLAKYFNVDPAIIRVIMVLLIFAHGLGIVAYVILAIITPIEPSESPVTAEAAGESIEEAKEPVAEPARDIHSSFSVEEGKTEHKIQDIDKTFYNRRLAIGIILIVFGAFFIVTNLRLFDWLHWGTFWPLIIVAIGLVIILAARRP